MQAAAAAIALPSPTLLALGKNDPYRANIGIQLYTLRDQIKADPLGTIKTVVDAGYKQGELYGFPNCKPMIEAARDSGLGLNSAHIQWECVTSPEKKGTTPFEDILAKAKEEKLSHLVIPYLHGHERKTLDDYKKLVDNCNKAAAEAKAAGIQLAYHNHAFEFSPMDGSTGYDVLMEGFSEDMKFEIDVFWIKVGGRDPVKMLKQLKGRVSQVHLKDLKTGSTVPNFGGVPKDAFQELGDGMIDMEPIIEASKFAEVAHCHVEQDQSPDPIASIKQSLAYLHTL